MKSKQRLTIGLFIGGDAKSVFVSEQQVKILIHQLKDACKELNAQVLITTSRRTPEAIEHLLHKEIAKDDFCPLLIVANRQNIPEAVGGIMGLADMIVVSGDSISMISEAASSGKKTIVFPAQNRGSASLKNKYGKFIDILHQEGYIISSDVRSIGQVVFDIAKNKIQTKKIDDNGIILEAVRKVI